MRLHVATAIALLFVCVRMSPAQVSVIKSPTRTIVVEQLRSTQKCQSDTCYYAVGGGSLMIAAKRNGDPPSIVVRGNLTNYSVMSFFGGSCVGVVRDDDQSEGYINVAAGKIGSRISICADEEDEPRAINPCDRLRPYKTWTNAELTTALLRYSASDAERDRKIAQQLLEESACRKY